MAVTASKNWLKRPVGRVARTLKLEPCTFAVQGFGSQLATSFWSRRSIRLFSPPRGIFSFYCSAISRAIPSQPCNEAGPRFIRPTLLSILIRAKPSLVGGRREDHLAVLASKGDDQHIVEAIQVMQCIASLRPSRTYSTGPSRGASARSRARSSVSPKG